VLGAPAKMLIAPNSTHSIIAENSPMTSPEYEAINCRGAGLASR